MSDYRGMWQELCLDLAAHDGLMQVLPPLYGESILSQEGRPDGMEYFDFVFSEIHGLRVKELVDHRKAGGMSIGGAHRPRIPLSGCPMAIPNWKVPTIIETSGALVAMDEMCTGIRYFRHLVDEDAPDTDGLLDSIANRYLKIDCAVFTPNQERLEHIGELVRDYDIDAVVYHALQFCDPYSVEAFRVEQAMQKDGMPFLYLETDYSTEDVGQLVTRVQALVEMVGSRDKA